MKIEKTKYVVKIERTDTGKEFYINVKGILKLYKQLASDTETPTFPIEKATRFGQEKASLLAKELKDKFQKLNLPCNVKVVKISVKANA